MARMHSRSKGKSGSKKPLKHVPAWTPYQGKEVEKLVVKYAKTGKTNAEIGLLLRDSYGINSVKALAGKKVGTILEESKVRKKLPDDVTAFIRRMIDIKAHLEKNRHDETAKRGLLLTSSKLRRVVKYYKRSGRLAQDWTLDPEKLKMYLE